jgi:hypothetical protein
VIFDYLGDETVQCAATGGCLLQHTGALVVGFDGALDGIDLAAQALEPIQQLGFFVGYVTHALRFLATRMAILAHLRQV